MGNASLELDKTMGPRPANSIRDRSLIDGFTKVRMYGCNLILRQPSLRNALQGGSDHVRYPFARIPQSGALAILWIGQPFTTTAAGGGIAEIVRSIRWPDSSARPTTPPPRPA